MLFIGSTREFYLEMPRGSCQSRRYGIAYVMMKEEMNPHSTTKTLDKHRERFLLKNHSRVIQPGHVLEQYATSQ